jgi:hypothetical protein
MTDPIDDEWTEAVDADIPRVDLVGRAANGSTGFLLMKQQDAGGLLDGAYVRELLAKAEPLPGPCATVTMTGSPAAIAAMIHGSPVRNAEGCAPATVNVDLCGSIGMSQQDAAALVTKVTAVAKAKYNAEQLRDLAAKGYAMKDPGGDISYPIADGEDIDAAIRAVGRGGEDHNKIRRFISRRAEEMDRKVPDNWASDGSLKKADISMDVDDGIDGMDPTVILAAPDEDTPGDPNDPGSPAWEAIDAATARKWTAILARARSALGVMSDREMLEAAGADPDDIDNAFDLDDAACAIDYAISTLAPFAVDEQAEADCGTAEMDALGKALGTFDAAHLDTVEALTQVRKSGRALSAANEATIRTAVASLQKVLASLPAAPTTEESGQPVAKTANEEPDMPEPTLSEDVTAASGQAPAMGIASPEPKPVAGVPVTVVAKAEKPAQVAIYDANGNLVGTVDPAEITMLTPAKAAAAPVDAAPADPATAEDPEAAPAAEPPAAAADLTPAPAAEAGTPADAVSLDDPTVAKASTAPSHAMIKSDFADMFKAAIDAHSAAQTEVIAKQAADLTAQAEVVKSLQEHHGTLSATIENLTKAVKNIEEQDAIPRVLANGAVPSTHLRGQDKGVPIDMDRGLQLRKQLATELDANKKKAIADEMNGLAIAELQKMQQRG